jgi:hypothetical protein
VGAAGGIFEAGLLAGSYSGDATYNTSVSQVLQYKYNAPGDFSVITATPDITIASGSSSSANLLVSSLAPFSGNVNLSCVVTGSRTPLPLCTVPASVAVTLNGTVSTTLQLQTSIPTKERRREPRRRRPVPAGTYTAVVTATNGSSTHNVTFTIVVQEAANR